MKITLLSLALAAMATANVCPNSIQSNPDYPCSYNVTCNVQGTSSGTAVNVAKAISLQGCIKRCEAYGGPEGQSCGSFNFEKTGKICSIYDEATFVSTKKTTGYSSGVTYGCG